MTQTASDIPEGVPAPQDAVRDEEHFVPAGLALLVLGLLLAVMLLGGYVLRGVVAGDRRAATVEQVDALRWEKAVKADSEDIEARVQLGYAYQKDKRYDKALEQYEFVLERDPRDTAALYNRAVVLGALGLDKEAESAFWDVLEVRSDHPLAAKALGEYYASKKQYRSVLKAVRPVVEVHPEMADLQYLTGLAYERTGRATWAIARYELALKYAPDMVEARRGLARVQGAQ